MNKFQIECLLTPHLIELRNEINEVLKKRARVSRVNRKSIRDADRLPIIEPKSQIVEYNSSGIYSIPNHRVKRFSSCQIYLHSLISQDWSHLYFGGDDEKKYYVYAHIDPRKTSFSATKSCGGVYGGQPFYIGKGCGERAYDLNRNQGHGKILNSIFNDGIPRDHVVKIIFNNLTESKAFELEAKLIYYFGTIYDKIIKKSGILVNLTIPIIPDFLGEMKKSPPPIKVNSTLISVQGKGFI